MARAKRHVIDEVYLGKLAGAIKTSRWSLERFRVNVKNAVKQMVGNNWSEEGAGERVPINLIYQYVSIMARSLVSKNPRVMLSTFQQEAKPAVKTMRGWMNEEIEDMGFAGIEQRIVIDALFCVGIGFVALAEPADCHLRGWNLKPGKPYFSTIHVDDFGFDPHARDFREGSFMCHRYRPTLESIRDSNLYSKDRKDLQASDDPFFNQEGDERINMLGRGYKGNQEELQERVDLWKVWIPDRKLILTLEAEAGGGGLPTRKKPLREQEWVGPDEGPYHLLGYGVVPGNAMPIAPIPNLYDLHIFTNQNFRKLMRQTQRQKKVLPVSGASAEDMERLGGTDDGFPFKCENRDGLKEVDFGGPNQVNLAMFMESKKLYDEMGGNLGLLGGTGPQSKTATQDKLLNENAGSGVADKQEATLKHVGSVLKALAWYWWHEPFSTYHAEEPLKGLPGMGIHTTLTPDQRQKIKWEDLRLKVDPYSLQAQTPQGRLMVLKETVKELIPLMALLQQQGIMFDVNAYLEKCGEYTDDPDLAEVFSLQEPMPQEDQGGGAAQAPGMANETTRNYVRENVSGKTQAGQTANTINTLMGGSSGEAEKNGAMVGMAG